MLEVMLSKCPDNVMQKYVPKKSIQEIFDNLFYELKVFDTIAINTIKNYESVSSFRISTS